MYEAAINMSSLVPLKLHGKGTPTTSVFKTSYLKALMYSNVFALVCCRCANAEHNEFKRQLQRIKQENEQ